MSQNLQVNLEQRILELEEENRKLKQKTKYGLVWEDKPEKVVEECKTKFPVLKVKEGKKFKEIVNDKNKPTNILIEGDNYHALSVLNYTHKNSIDVIYIDPPYNTGEKDFRYNDEYVDIEDSFRHSKWLSFMEKRLSLAKKLLSDKGAIFISIDENEQAQLKLLCDSVFGENNFINLISVKAKVSAGASGGGEDRKLKKNIEYILCYGGSSFDKFDAVYKFTELQAYIQEMKLAGKSYKYTSVLTDEGKRVYVKSILDGSGEEIKIFKHTGYKIKSINSIKKEEQLTEEEVYNKYFDKVMTTTNAQTSIRQRIWDATDSENTFYSAEYVPKSGRNKNKVSKIYLMGKKKVLIIWLKDTAEIIKNKIYKKEKWGTFWDKISYNNVNKEGSVDFSNGKKPIELIKRLLSLFKSNTDLSVLDFFAGSGSTGHAVLDLNKEDKGNRKFILVTNNGDEKSEHKICEEVTYKRLSNIMQKDMLGGNLKYLQTDFIDRTKHTDNMKMRLMRACTEMLCLKENTFNLEKEVVDGGTLMYKIFSGVNAENGEIKKQVIGIYYDLDDSYLDNMRADLKNYGEQDKSAYIFSLRNVDDFIDDYRKWKGINIEEIPQKILEIYEAILKNNSRHK
jgi:adenine-specific DNA-methyltransferase